MSISQALAIAAASLVLALDMQPAASFQMVRAEAAGAFTRYGQGFEATPDGFCVEHASMPR